MSHAILQNHLRGLSESLANDIARLSQFAFFPCDFHKNEDARQAAIELVLRGHPAAKAIRHARAQVARDFRPAGFASLDSETENVAQLHERIASAETEEIERWRVESLDKGMEVLLAALADGAASLVGCGKVTGKAQITKRRAQQIVEEAIKKAKGDGQGQGDMFGFVSSPSPKPSRDGDLVEMEVEHE